MKLSQKLTRADFFVLENYLCTGDRETRFKVSARIDNCEFAYPNQGETLRIIDEGFREWYMFGGYCMSYALIHSDSFESAFEIYLEECVPCDDILDTEDQDEIDCGMFDGSGNWYSEATIGNIVGLSVKDYYFDISIEQENPER